MSIEIREASSAQLTGIGPALADMLIETVHGGSPLGFLAPLARDDALAYWRSLGTDLDAGRRVLLVAVDGDEIVGSGQLGLTQWSNGRHRAELQKLLVRTERRGEGVGRLLVTALHQAARQRGRTLIMLDTRRGSTAERFYRGLGYRELGVVPGYAVGASGERFDTVFFYTQL